MVVARRTGSTVTEQRFDSDWLRVDPREFDPPTRTERRRLIWLSAVAAMVLAVDVATSIGWV